MRKMMVAAAMAVALAGSPAAAESWRLAAANDGAMMFVDTDSLTRRGDTVMVRVMTVALPARPGDWDRSLVLREIDCAGSRSSMLDRSFYDGPRLISSSTNRERQDSHTPDSMMGGVVQVTCGRRPYESEAIADPYGTAMATLRRGTTGRK